MYRIANILTVLLFFVGISAASAAETVIGSVVRCQGACLGVSTDLTESLTEGTDIRVMEKVSTGAGGRLELGFADGTHLTVGENAEVVLDEFVYDPAGANRFHAAVTGAFRYVSGKLPAGATRQASVTTPFALIGVRGTDFWGGLVGGVNGVVVFEGAVSVTTAAGSVILSAPGEGTNVSATDAPPSPVTQWSEERTSAAIATVTFQ